jgi:hypothetical protein
MNQKATISNITAQNEQNNSNISKIIEPIHLIINKYLKNNSTIQCRKYIQFFPSHLVDRSI